MTQRGLYVVAINEQLYSNKRQGINNVTFFFLYRVIEKDGRDLKPL